MKKMLVLILVLGIASLASAQLQISVNGDQNPVDSEITIAPSDHLTLDVHGNLAAPGNANWMLVVEAACGTLDGTQGTTVGALSRVNENPTPYDYSYITGYNLGYAGLPNDGSLSAVSGILGDLGALDGVLVDLIDFHCEGQGDAVIKLWQSPDGVQWSEVDAVIVHQVPEPATMALLGLGALVLRRKK